MPRGDSYRLTKGRKNKADEFYTQYKDIEEEIELNMDYFNNKVIYCPTDNEDSNFYKFFKDNKVKLHYKKLICSSKGEKGHVIIIDNTTEVFDLQEDGDFRSDECQRFFDECDIVVTNPPFSLFKDFVECFFNKGKDVLVIGNMNAMSSKGLFELIKNNVIIAKPFKGLAGYFISPYEDYSVTKNKQDGLIRVQGVVWFTTLKSNIKKLECNTVFDVKTAEYFDGTDILNIDEVKKIPNDYLKLIGVPITYLLKHDKDVFDIIGMDKDFSPNKGRFKVNGKTKYCRIIIKKKIYII